MAARLNAGHEMAPFEGVGTKRELVGSEYAAFAKGLKRDDAAWFWYCVYEEGRSRDKLLIALTQIIAEGYDKSPRPQGLAERLLHEFVKPSVCLTCNGSGRDTRAKACQECAGRGRVKLSMRNIAARLGVSSSVADRDKHIIRSVITQCDKWLEDRQNNVESRLARNFRNT